MSSLTLITIVLVAIFGTVSVLVFREGIKALRMGRKILATGQTPKGNAVWHNLEGPAAKKMGRGFLIASLFLIGWAIIFAGGALSMLINL